VKSQRPISQEKLRTKVASFMYELTSNRETETKFRILWSRGTPNSFDLDVSESKHLWKVLTKDTPARRKLAALIKENGWDCDTSELGLVIFKPGE